MRSPYELGLRMQEGGRAWTLSVACKTDPDLFFAYEELRGRPKKESIERAKTLCGACPVRTTCLEKTIVRETTLLERTPGATLHGVVAGMTGTERKKMIRRGL